MKTIINLKALLIFLSLAALLLGSCKAGDKLGSETQDSQISGGESVSNSLNTSFPTWDIDTHFIPQEYWGDYDLFQDEHSVVYRATVTHANIDFYYIVHYGDSYSSYLKTNITLNINVFDKNAEYRGNNTWTRVSLISNSPFTSVVIIKLERNEKGQRVLSYNYKDDIGNGNEYTSPYIHEDDINK